MQKVGVFVCWCGSNIAATVDVEKVAQGVVELCKQMAVNVPMAAAGGLADGGIGTDFQKICGAVETVQSEDGVAVLFDMGSALMTAEMVMDAFEGVTTIKLADAPIVEGAIAAAIAANIGLPLELVVQSANEANGAKKLQ